MKWHAFSEVVTDATSKFRKIKASDYKAKGKYKIIDQGKAPIAGYTDEASLVNDQLLPILIFGDHTRLLKYEDEPIALGADGAKALLVNSDLAIARYVYYYLRSIEIKEAGYSRHFKFLKEVKVPIPFKDGAPDFDDQIRIVDLLGKVESLTARRKQHLQQLDDLLKSAFLEMFGDPVRNEKGWDERQLGEAFKIKHGFAFTSEFFSDKGSFVLLTPGNFFEKGGFRDRGEKQKFYVGDAPSEYILKKGSLLIAMTEQAPGLLGSPLLVPESSVYLHNQRLGLVVEREPIQPAFLFHLFNQKSIRLIIHSKATGTKVRHTSPTKLEDIVVGYPPLVLQNRFAAIVEKVEGIKSRYQQSLTDLEALYGVLSQQAFRGELDLSRLPLPGTKPEEDNAVVIEPLHAAFEQVISISLPDTDNLLGALESAEARAALITQWLEVYRGQLGNTPFSVRQFLEAAQIRLTELHPDDDFELGVNDYEHIKTWVFEALNTGTLMQAFDDEGNRIQLKAVQV